MGFQVLVVFLFKSQKYGMTSASQVQQSSWVPANLAILSKSCSLASMHTRLPIPANSSLSISPAIF